jgi:hypothetical protein
LTVAGHSQKRVSVRTYCIDSDRSVPENQETYYLATDASHLQGSSLCDVVNQATDPEKIAAAQGNIWENINTIPKAESGGTGALPAADDQESTHTWVDSIPTPVAQAATAVGSLALLATLIVGVSKFGGMTMAGKSGWVVGMVVSAAVAAGGGAVWYAQNTPQPSTKTNTNASAVVNTNQEPATAGLPTSLVEAQQAGQVVVEATANGSFTSMDVTVHNLGDQSLTLNMECMIFIPDTVIPDELNSQRLISDDVISEPPLTPDDPPEPEETLDLDKLQKEFERKVADEKQKYDEDPTEQNLKDLMKDLAKCQLVGCSQEEVGNDLGESWQQNVDQATKNYQQNPSDENYNALKRAVEIGQLLGSDTQAGVDLLIPQ